jgi:hypothetical protein
MDARRLAVALVGSLALSASAVIPVFAAPPSNGGPAGYELLSVVTLTAEGYKVPALVDSPTSGVLSYGLLPGNGDGWVCGVPLGNQLTSFGLPVYVFTDDQLPAS